MEGLPLHTEPPASGDVVGTAKCVLVRELVADAAPPMQDLKELLEIVSERSPPCPSPMPSPPPRSLRILLTMPVCLI